MDFENTVATFNLLNYIGGVAKGGMGGGGGLKSPKQKFGETQQPLPPPPHISVPKVSLAQHKIDIQSLDLCTNLFITIALGSE